ncbi:MAG: DUF4230 domain-containing protein, partial [Clostridia bacterium]|nr:DUF4230 domain-containing protein [Clostridia bacterium]
IMKNELREKLQKFKKVTKDLYHNFVVAIKPIFLITLFFVVLLFVASAKIEELEAKLRAALQETEHTEITEVHIENKINQIGELATISFEYTNETKIENTRQLLGIDILGTTHSLDIIYSGIIKVGYDVEEIDSYIDQERKLIMVQLPEARVLDNYILLDNMKCSDKNNIFNPIGSDDILKYFSDIKDKELKLAEEKGIYKQAEEQLKMIINNFLAEFDGYIVAFTK